MRRDKNVKKLKSTSGFVHARRSGGVVSLVGIRAVWKVRVPAVAPATAARIILRARFVVEVLAQVVIDVGAFLVVITVRLRCPTQTRAAEVP